MNCKRFKNYGPLALAVGVLMLLLAAPARGGHVSGGGWMASWDSSLDNMIGLTLLSTSNNNVSFAAHLQHEGSPISGADFEPMAFTFQQTSSSAKSMIVIEQEAVVNQTTSAWGGYDFMLTPSAASGVAFDQLTLAPDHSLSIAPFTTRAIEESGKELYVGGGTMPAGPAGENVWNPGQSDGALYINGAPLEGPVLRTFTLLQRPSAATTAIPLPPAGIAGLWTVGALGLGKLLETWRRIRAT